MENWDDRFGIPIADLDFSVRTRNRLDSVGVETVGHLARQTEERLRRIRGFGDLCLYEIERRLRELDLHLGMDPEAERPAQGPFCKLNLQLSEVAGFFLDPAGPLR